MGQPGHRVPIGGMKRSESPENPLGSQAIFNVVVLGNVFGIIKIDEVKSLYLPIDSKCRNDQNKTKEFSSMFLV